MIRIGLRNDASRLAATLLLSLVAVSAIGGSGGANALPPEKVPAFAVPRMTQPPVIDGKIGQDEWREAMAVSGVGNLTDDVLVPRPTMFYFAWDEGHFYFASRTYLRPNYKPNVKSGRSQGLAYVWDDGLELHWQPMGANVPGENRNNSYKWFLNCLGFIGDCSRLALGQQFKNWNPQFVIKTHLTDPGTAPDGGRWWEMEMSSIPSDFELKGPNRAGDKWRVMLGINHIPVWMQARLPCNGSYLDPFGYNVLTLVDKTPAVQMIMDSLHNPATDGTAAMKIRAFNPATAPAELSVEINVADAVKKSEKLTVPPGGSAEFALDEKLPDAVKSGRVWVEVRQGDLQLFRHTFNFQAGAHAWMTAPLAPQNATNFAFETRFNPVRSWLLVKADTYYLDDSSQARLLRYRVVPEGGNAAIAEGAISQVAEYYLQDVIRLPELKPGRYVIESSMELADGRTLGPMSAVFRKEDEATIFGKWWNKKAGDIERVLPPYTAIKRVQDTGARVRQGDPEPRTLIPDTFSLLGREYAFDALGLPTVVRSAGEAVLAAPARIVVTIGGQETIIPVGRPEITEQKDWRVRFKGRAQGAGLDFEASGWLEQDGLVYVDLTFGASDGRSAKIDALRIEYPLAETDADCLLCIGPGANYSSRTTMLLPRGKTGPSAALTTGRLWSTLDTGITGCGMAAGSFYPTVWIGNERRGFLWWADNDKGWVQEDSVPAHEVVRVQGSGETTPQTCVVLRNNIIAKQLELKGLRTISFSYMATPFKPMPKGFRMTMTTEDGTFWNPFRGVRKDSKTGAPVQEVRGHCNWIHPESRYPEEWPALWAEQKAQADAHARQHQWYDPYKARSGINFTHMSFQIIGYGRKSCEDWIYEYFGPEWETGGNDVWNESYIDYAMNLFVAAFKDGGVRHTYWDLAFPMLFNDLLSGLAYRLPDGRVQPGYNGWNVRRFMMRLWALMLDAGLTPGGIGFHSTNAYLPIAMPWADAVTDAERPFHLDSNPLDWVDNYPPERMRAMSVCHSWGSAVAWMSMFEGGDWQRRIDAARKQAQWVWMHDSWLNNWLSADHQPVLSIMPDPVLDWGVNAAVYHPYWRNPFVTCADKDILVSLWHTPGEGRAALGIFNYNREKAKDAELAVDLERLGLRGNAYARTLFQDGGALAEFDAQKRVLRVAGLPAHKMIMVGIAAHDKAALDRAAKALPDWAPASEAVIDFGMVQPETRYHKPGRAPGVSCSNVVVKVGMWQLPDRVMLTVYNSSKNAAQDAELKVDLDAWRLAPELPWQEFVRVRQLYAEQNAPGPELDFHGRKLSVKAIPPGSGRLIAIRRY